MLHPHLIMLYRSHPKKCDRLLVSQHASAYADLGYIQMSPLSQRAAASALTEYAVSAR